MKGFTLPEILIALGIAVILLSVSLSVGTDFYQTQQLDNFSQRITGALRRAELMAMSSQGDSDHGVYFEQNRYILFKGNSFSSRDAQYDEIFDLPFVLSLSGLAEAVFQKPDGLPKESPAFCSGICQTCGQFTQRNPCRNQQGCSWNQPSRICSGTCLSCGAFSQESDCSNQQGCAWSLGQSGGTVVLTGGNKQINIDINQAGRVNVR